MTLAPRTAHLPGIKIDVIPGSCDDEQVVIVVLDKTYACNISDSTEWWTVCGFARVIQSIPRSEFRVISFCLHSGITLVGTTLIPRMTPHRLGTMLEKVWDEYVAGGDPTAVTGVLSDKIGELNNVIYVSAGRVVAVTVSPCQIRAAGLRKRNLAAHLLARGYVIHAPFICSHRRGVNLLVSCRDLSATVSPEELRVIFQAMGVRLTIVHELAA